MQVRRINQDPDATNVPGENTDLNSTLSVKEHDQTFARDTAVSIGKYRCSSGGNAGYFTCTTEVASFQPLSSSGEPWTVRYEELKVIEKVILLYMSLHVLVGSGSPI